MSDNAGASVPVARFYRGRPVKRMYRSRKGIVLVMLNAVPGERGEQLIVTQADWDQHGELRVVESNKLSDLRRLVAD